MGTHLRPAVLSLLTTAALVGCLVAGLVAPAQAGGHTAMKERIVALANNARAAHDEPALRAHDCLTRFAQRQARRQARQDRMFHQDLGAVMGECHLSAVGENVAYGFSTARSVHRAWMNSPGHRANILNRTYRRVGVGVARSDGGSLYYAVVFGRR